MAGGEWEGRGAAISPDYKSLQATGTCSSERALAQGLKTEFNKGRKGGKETHARYSWTERLWPGQPVLLRLLKMVCETATRVAPTPGVSLSRDNQESGSRPVPGAGLDPPSFWASTPPGWP